MSALLCPAATSRSSSHWRAVSLGAPLGVLVDSVQVGAQQFDQELVPFGEAAAVTA
jgi:hypothetical protein